jgi:hypothetical protein
MEAAPHNEDRNTESSHEVEWTNVELQNANLPQALKNGEMLATLLKIEAELPELLKDSSRWKSLDVSYHPPRVERVFMQHGELRVSLHCIHPCERSEALFHPHPWPSAMRILSGNYEMAVGYGAGQSEPPIAATVVAGPGTSYEMADPDAWHYVRPIGGPALTLMITTKPWSRSTPKSSEPLLELPEPRKEEILNFFRSRYPDPAALPRQTSGYFE